MTAPEHGPGADNTAAADDTAARDAVTPSPAEVLVGQAADPRAEVLAEHPDSDVAGGAMPDVDAGDEAFDRGADPAS